MNPVVFLCFSEVPLLTWNPSTRSELTRTYTVKTRRLGRFGATGGLSTVRGVSTPTLKAFRLPLCRGPVLSLAMTSSGEQCFSGGIDSTIQWWNIPGSNVDPYDTYGMWTRLLQRLLPLT